MRTLLRRVFDYRKITLVWYVPMIFLMPVMLVLTYLTMRLMGLSLPEPSAALLEIPILFVAYLISAVSEDAGWTGYVVDPMQARWSAFSTGVIMGAVWGIWHTVPYIQADHPAVWVTGQTLGAIPLRILIVWLYNNTGASMFAAIVLHTMTNVSESVFPDYSSRRPGRPRRTPYGRSRDRHVVVGLRDLDTIPAARARAPSERRHVTLELQAIGVSSGTPYRLEGAP
ncbi:MAG TPA: CPBP family intramembrane glutamic endopeptidase [Actinomycetota bacterium]|nr:CPBP family intramembrane glutamic endopeptidase [Actinomycetota bacterium]